MHGFEDDDEDVLSADELANPPPNARPNAILLRSVTAHCVQPVSMSSVTALEATQYQTCRLNASLPTRHNLVSHQWVRRSHLVAPGDTILTPRTIFLGLEWVDDTNVVVVWETASQAKLSHTGLRLDKTVEQDEEGFILAHPLPEPLWPVESRRRKAMGETDPEGETAPHKGQIRIRWARPEDVKQKNARNKSRFYEKHGQNAGKDGQNMIWNNHDDDAAAGGSSGNNRSRPSGRGRRGDDESEEARRQRLDAELDSFIAGEEPPPRRSASPPPRHSSSNGTNNRRRRRSASPRRRTFRADVLEGAEEPEEGTQDPTWSSGFGNGAFGSRNNPRRDNSRRGVSVGNSSGVREWDMGKDAEPGVDTDEFGRSDRSGPSRRRERGTRGGRRRRGGGDADATMEDVEVRQVKTKDDLDAELDAFRTHS